MVYVALLLLLNLLFNKEAAQTISKQYSRQEVREFEAWYGYQRAVIAIALLVLLFVCNWFLPLLPDGW